MPSPPPENPTTATSGPPEAGTARRKRALLALLLSTLLGLCALEFGARWHALKGFDAAVDSVLHTKFAAQANSIARVVPHPELGFWRNPLHPQHNSLGLRGGEEMLGPRADDRLRVLVLGDSVAYPPEGFVRDLELGLAARSKRPVEVINGAIHGYTTYQERLYLERILPALDVDLVLLQYCLNDNYDFLHQITESGNMLLTLEAKSHLFPQDGGWLATLTRSSYFVYGLRKTLYQRSQEAAVHPWEDRVFGSAWRPETWEKQRAHLQDMALRLAQKHVPFALLAVPHEGQLDKQRQAAYPGQVRYPQAQLGTLCAELKIPYLDLFGAFTQAQDAALFTDGIHLSEAGHRLAGTALLSFLDERGLLPGL